MKRFCTGLYFTALVIFSLAPNAFASGGPFGLGIILGEPTGINGKLYLGGKTNAIDGAAAWSFSGDNDFHLHGDYLYHNYGWIEVKKGELPVYFGIGARLKIRDNAKNKFGVRVPVGLDYIFADAPFDVFVEVVPILELAPDTDFTMEGAVGGRFYF